jgi:hypothetical protein
MLETALNAYVVNVRYINSHEIKFVILFKYKIIVL